MKSKRIFAVAAALAIFASGCSESSPVPPEDGSTLTTTSAQTEQSETEASQTETETETEAETETMLLPSDEISLYDLTSNEQMKLPLMEARYNGEVFMWCNYGDLYQTELIGDKTALIVNSQKEEFNCVRNTTGQLAVNEKELKSMDFNSIFLSEFLEPVSPLDGGSAAFCSPYEYSYSDPIVYFPALTLEDIRLCGEDEEYFPEAEFLYSYCLDGASIKAFIRRNDDGDFEVIPDPSCMNGIPLYHNSEKFCHYSINGTEIKADTIAFTVKNSRRFSDETAAVLNEIGSDFVYVRMNVDFTCCFSSKRGYIPLELYHEITDDYYMLEDGFINSIEILNTDTDEVLTYFGAPYGDKPAADMYAALVTGVINYLAEEESFITNRTCGICLADLDYDDFPELLVSDYTYDESMNINYTNVKIYRIDTENVQVSYIGSIFTPSGKYNVICPFKDSEKWYYISCLDPETMEEDYCGYELILNGDEIELTQVYDIAYGEDGLEDAYLYGELMDCGGEYAPYVLGEEMISYNESNLDSPLFLYSPWLVTVSSNNELPEYADYIYLTPRTVSYQLENMCEQWYADEYAIANAAFDYSEYFIR